MRTGHCSPSIWTVVIATLVLAGCTDPAPDDPFGPGAQPTDAWTWATASAPGLARSEAQCASDGTTLLLIGGFTGSMTDPVTPTTEVYDLTSDTWRDGPLLPSPMHHTGVAYAQGRFWVAGGYAGQGFTPHNLLLSWAPGEGTWTIESPLPTARGAHGVGVWHDRLVLVGGVGAAGFELEVDIYNITDGTWSRADALATAREHHAVAASNQSIIAAGGRAGGFATNVATSLVLDPRTGHWTDGPPLATARGGVGGAASPHGVFVVGGEATGGTFPHVELFANGTWDRLPDLGTPRHGVCAAWLDDGLHVVAGGEEPGWTVSDTHEVLRKATRVD